MIYTIKAGDTLYKIAQTYGTTVDELVAINGLNRPNDLAIGQNIWIPTNTPANTSYTVKAGDTMYIIANNYGISLNSLISANPQITNPNYITIGQVINIPTGKPLIEVNGYAIANINESILGKTLPYLTYLSIFSYQAKADGTLTPLYEDNLIAQARNSNVAPNMVVTNIGDSGGFDSDLATTILNDPITQENFINNIVSTATSKNYYGVDIDFEYLYPEDKMAYITFLRNLKYKLTPLNLALSVAVAPKYRDNQMGILY